MSKKIYIYFAGSVLVFLGLGLALIFYFSQLYLGIFSFCLGLIPVGLAIFYKRLDNLIIEISHREMVKMIPEPTVKTHILTPIPIRKEAKKETPVTKEEKGLEEVGLEEDNEVELVD